MNTAEVEADEQCMRILAKGGLKRSVIGQDDEVDILYKRVFEEVLGSMQNDPRGLHRGIHFQSVAKWLERMADHATNIAEQVIHMFATPDGSPSIAIERIQAIVAR